MLPKELPEIERLQECFYIQQGKLYKSDGSEVNPSPHKSGYQWVSVDGSRHAVHRVVLSLTLGRTLARKEQVDHIDGDTLNNAPSNLRVSDPSKNARNQKVRKNNVSGVMGVRKCAKTGRWRVIIGHMGKNVHIGYFDCFNAAVAARKEAERQFGYDKLHGER